MTENGEDVTLRLGERLHFGHHQQIERIYKLLI